MHPSINAAYHPGLISPNMSVYLPDCLAAVPQMCFFASASEPLHMLLPLPRIPYSLSVSLVFENLIGAYNAL